MRKLLLLAGVAALGIAMPAAGKNQGGGRGHGGAAHAERQGGGHGGPGRSEGRAERGRGHGGGGIVRGRGRDDRRAERRLDPREQRVERAIRDERRAVRAARREQRRFEPRSVDDSRRIARRAEADRRDWRRWVEQPTLVRDRDGPFGPAFSQRGRRLAVGPAGCPPGLARQNALCLPPGQFRRAQFIGQRLPLARLGYNVPERYRYRFADDGRFFYRYGEDGAIYRFDRASGLVSSIVPLASTGLMLGEPLPLGYDVYNVPLAYRSFYLDTDDYLYRYDGNAIYRVDSESRLVDGIVALLTGGSGGLGALGVGDLLPSGYDVYNVPLDYRDTYYDTDDSLYRYADGAIYQVDPQTRLIESVISLLT